MNTIFLYLFLALVLGGLIFGWFHSPRTKKLVKFTIIVILVSVVLFVIIAIIRKIWFPLPPF
jgi:tetrahydromethanopterin S-methyltransferase subunit D